MTFLITVHYIQLFQYSHSSLVNIAHVAPAPAHIPTTNLQIFTPIHPYSMFTQAHQEASRLIQDIVNPQLYFYIRYATL